MIDRHRIGTSPAAKRLEQAGLAFLARQAAEAVRSRAFEMADLATGLAPRETVQDWVSRQREIWAQRQPEVVPSAAPSWRRILEEVCELHKVSIDDVLSASRKEDLIGPRFEACYRLCAETNLSLPQIGSKLNRDHTSVRHAVRSYAERNGLQVPRQARGEAA